jgi:hypothetical protein
MKQKKHIFIPVLLSIFVMALDLIIGFVSALVDLVRMSLIVAIPAFLLCLPGQRLLHWLEKRYKLSWIVAGFLTIFLILLPIVFILYLVPYWIGYSESALVGLPTPEFMQITALDYAMAFVATVVKNVLSAFLFAILLMPLLFFASFVQEYLEKRFKLNALANVFAATFLTSALAWAIILFAFPWIVNAVFWKLYWSPI